MGPEMDLVLSHVVTAEWAQCAEADNVQQAYVGCFGDGLIITSGCEVQTLLSAQKAARKADSCHVTSL